MCLSSNFLSFLHSLGFNVYALQGVQRPSPCDTLRFTPPSHSARFSISILHTSFGLSVTQGLNLVSTCVKVPHLGAFTCFQYLNSPLIPLSNFLHSFTWSQDFPSGLLTTFCMHLNFVSMPRLPPLSLNNFLRSAGFNIQLPPRCLSSNFLNFLHSLGFNIFALQGVQRPSPCDTLSFPPPSHSALFSVSTLHTSFGLSVTRGSTWCQPV